MHQQHLGALQVNQKILCPSVDALHTLSLKPLNEVERKGKAQIRASLLNLEEATAFKYRLQTPTHNLNFRQFRHGPRTGLSSLGRRVAEALS